MADLGKIEGKTFLITGAASGLGAGYVESFLKEGAKSIAIVDIAENKGNELAEKLNKSYPGKVVFVKCDVSSEEDIQAAFSEVVTKFGTLDVVINNAGILNDSPQTWRKQCEVNYAGLVSFSLKAIKHMSISEGGKGGTIVNISSALGLLRFPFLPIYSATKAAVLHFSVSIAMDPFYERTGVRVLTMCFGATDTPLLEKLHITGYDEFNSEMMGMSPETSGPFQKPESAVKGVVDMFKRGSNGSVWLSIYNNEVVEITSDISNAFEILDKKYKLT